MKYVNQLTAIFVMTISLLSSCSVDSTLSDATKECSEYYVIASEPEFSSEYDKQISLFTKTIRNAIANSGRTYTNYFDNPEIELLFPNYGAKIRLSEKP